VLAILRYRLYDIDAVINKTVVYGLLAGVITAVSVGTVVGLGALAGAGSPKPNLGRSILATAAVAVAFQPVRGRAARLATGRGERLGALSLTKAPGERLTPAEEHLARDLASGAGLVLRNVRLTEELLQRLKELQASRIRIVHAQDQERRRLERNIHDGAQQQL